MLYKLAERNVKRQLSNYFIYFITVSLTIALMTAINNVVFNEDIVTYANGKLTMKFLLIGLTVIVAGISSFVLSYATSFMLKLRKREFGTYLTLGMTRKNILSMFACETFLLFLVAIVLGSIVGYFIYQGLMMMIAYLLEMQMSFASYSGKALNLTLIMVATIFVISSLASAIYLKKASIFDLLHSGKKVYKSVKHPILWFIFTIISLAVMILSTILSYKFVIKGITGSSVMSQIMLSITALFISIGTFITGFSKSLVNVLLKNQKVSSKGTTKFVLRQLSEKLNSTSVMAGLISILLTISIVFTNMAFGQKTTQAAALDLTYPFDIKGYFNTGMQMMYSPEEAETIINKYVDVKDQINYNTYSTGNNQLISCTNYKDKTGLCDTVMKESDYNHAMKILGYDEIDLKDSFYIINYATNITENNFIDSKIELDGKTYSFEGYKDNIPKLTFVYFIAVLPDEAFKNLNIETSYYCYNIKNHRFDINGLYNELSYQTQSVEGDSSEESNYFIKDYEKRHENVLSANAIIGSIYVSVVFICLAMAILALKTLSGMSDDKEKYNILFKLGTKTSEQKKALFLQIFSFFAVPFIIPLVICVPIGVFCSKIITLAGFPQFTGQIFINCAIIDVVIILLYFLYFTATYLIAKKNIIRE